MWEICRVTRDHVKTLKLVARMFFPLGAGDGITVWLFWHSGRRSRKCLDPNVLVSETFKSLEHIFERKFPFRWGWGGSAMAPRSTAFAWKVPWTEEPGGLQSMGSLRVGHNWATSLSLFTFMHWRRRWRPTPVFLPGESQGWQSLVPSMGSHIVGHDWSDLAAAGGDVLGSEGYICSAVILPNDLISYYLYPACKEMETQRSKK